MNHRINLNRLNQAYNTGFSVLENKLNHKLKELNFSDLSRKAILAIYAFEKIPIK